METHGETGGSRDGQNASAQCVPSSFVSLSKARWFRSGHFKAACSAGAFFLKAFPVENFFFLQFPCSYVYMNNC